MKTFFTAPLLFLATFLFGFSAYAQVGIGTTTPHTSAQLEGQSSSKGLLIPRVTSVASITRTPAEGLLVY